MRAPARLALGFVLSLTVAAGLQHAVLAGYGGGDATAALVALAGLVAMITAVFGLVVWHRWSAARIRRTALAILAVLLVLGLGLWAAGTLMSGPGLGGRIAEDLAVLVDLAILLPAAAAVPVHWLFLRHAQP
ncbi:MAG: hypothetical protein HXX10_00670 [Rhodoplanes sp.]|uniref:hypothetical protein n=1 Tax=Rhodoplanes sp. TaxID=1968906 RepID=UPI0018245346|nr:hypothetical protein [Rhodoplanes sp.]NVO12528.1 hypothetical protein [Rhodoplanes sp.]